MGCWALAQRDVTPGTGSLRIRVAVGIATSYVTASLTKSSYFFARRRHSFTISGEITFLHCLQKAPSGQVQILPDFETEWWYSNNKCAGTRFETLAAASLQSTAQLR